jgi:hypothetical protein
MDFNSLFFPSPKSTYSPHSYPGEILYLEKQLGKSEVTHVPCLYIRYERKYNLNMDGNFSGKVNNQ